MKLIQKTLLILKLLFLISFFNRSILILNRDLAMLLNNENM